VVLNTKGEKLLGQSKRTMPQPNFLKLLIFQIETISSVKNFLTTKRSKTCLCQKGRIYSGREFICPNKKHLKKGENSSKLRNVFENSFIMRSTKCKITLKRFYQKFPKINASGANVVQNVKSFENTHIHLEMSSFQ
jgi:uncharacterized membrane protein